MCTELVQLLDRCVWQGALGIVGIVLVMGQVLPLLARQRLPLVSSVVVSAWATIY